MPPHALYVEPYLGSGTVFYAKRPAAFSIVADRDAGLIALHLKHRRAAAAYLVADALQLLPSLNLTAQDLVYLDPPYHPDTRNPAIYKYETDHQHHALLLAMLQELPCMVMLSGYDCPEYRAELGAWWREDYKAMTRGGPRIETLWCNFTPGAAFHDARYVGGNFRERERIKRKKQRWASRLAAMPPAERAAVREALDSLEQSTPAPAMGPLGGG
ncbi:MAG TPA: DNA adenine methylase [Reyranellaceae bacterium]|nr:DNA adenine methylase [Reyranellaceae bacterium]